MSELLSLMLKVYQHTDAVGRAVIRVDSPAELGCCKLCDGPTEGTELFCRPCRAQIACDTYLMYEHASSLAASMLVLVGGTEP